MSNRSGVNGLQDLLRQRKVIVVCGTGGVGKTTVSASLALSAARQGLRVLVMTIDPARRLASALGIDELLNQASPIDTSSIPGGDWKLPEGATLDAMMLDAKSTWDEVVHRFAPNIETRERILANRYYQRATGSLAGSQEYMAMEKLLEVVRSEHYDLVVLDTPPTRNALAFLRAPERMMSILQDSIVKWIAPSNGRLSAARAGAMLFGVGKQTMFSMFERFIGSDVLSGISEFISSFSGLIDGMRSRAGEVMTLLRSEDAAFVLVASPSSVALSEALYFHDQLANYDIAVHGIIVNRTRREVDADGSSLPETAWKAGFTPSTGQGRDPLIDSLWNRYLAERELAQLDDRSIAELRSHCGQDLPFARIPRLQGEVHDLEALAQVARLLSSN